MVASIGPLRMRSSNSSSSRRRPCSSSYSSLLFAMMMLAGTIASVPFASAFPVVPPAAFVPTATIIIGGSGSGFQTRRSMIVTRGASTSTSSVDAEVPVASSSLNHVPGLRAVADSSRYSTFLLDMWGVLHDGIQPYEGVLDAISNLRGANKRMIVLSNSSKRVSHAIKMLSKLGFDPDDFADVITSGEVSHRLLSGDDTLGCQRWPILTNLIESSERKVFVLGSGDGDEEYCESAGWTLTSPEKADLLLARGTFTLNDGNVVSKKIHGEEVYFSKLEEVLELAASRRIPMLVANPDRVRPDESMSPMPGAIGGAYEKALETSANGGGLKEEEIDLLIKRIGKPHREVYDLAMMSASAAIDSAADAIDASECIMVGDALETDVLGGTKASTATLWVINYGIHSRTVKEASELDDDNGHERGSEQVLRRFNEERGYMNGEALVPTFVAPHFRW